MLSVGGTVCRGHWIVCDALTAEDYTNAIICIFPLATNIKLPDIARSHIRSIQLARGGEKYVYHDGQIHILSGQRSHMRDP